MNRIALKKANPRCPCTRRKFPEMSALSSRSFFLVRKVFSKLLTWLVRLIYHLVRSMAPLTREIASPRDRRRWNIFSSVFYSCEVLEDSRVRLPGAYERAHETPDGSYRYDKTSNQKNLYSYVITPARS